MLHARRYRLRGSTSRPTAIRELRRRQSIRLPHAIKELKELGLLERLDAVAIRTRELFYIPIASAKRSGASRAEIDAGYDVPQFSIHRGRLQGVIYQAGARRPARRKPFFTWATDLGSFRQDDAGVHGLFLLIAPARHRATAPRRRVDRPPTASTRSVRSSLFSQRRPRRAGNGTMLWRGANRLADVSRWPLDVYRGRHGGEVRAL